MFKQSPNRNQRTKELKVKRGFKIFTLIAFVIWLLYQLKHSHDKKSYEGSSPKVFENLKVGPETKNLGRKGFQPWINKPYELMDGAEKKEPERVKEQNSGGDEDIVGHEEEPEEVEDLIDEEDQEKEEQNDDDDDEEGEEEKEMGKLIEDQGHDEGEKDTQATSEKHYKEIGASKVVMRVTQSLGSEFEFGGSRKVKEVENSEKFGTVKQLKKIMDPSRVIVHATDSNSSPKVVDNVTIKHGSYPNVLLTKGIDDVDDFDARSNADSLLETGI
ncbi:hypothetical protein RJT34_10070 [Clitoria ternatea]|uniref:Uncharacterized protein n=1 Tax=Clitoria ternatea TaxID=43366 RepID=A0AAN9K8J1_CLITE